ncbi:MAG: GYD domain-containing protein [Opitutaceae bacterium]|nr:GYD domain-containing protein [Opitutaceae bacterium]
MTRYVTLIRFTDQGARTLGKSSGRALAFRQAAEKEGVKVETQLWTAGSCDGVLILSGDEKKRADKGQAVLQLPPRAATFAKFPTNKVRGLRRTKKALRGRTAHRPGGRQIPCVSKRHGNQPTG